MAQIVRDGLEQELEGKFARIMAQLAMIRGYGRLAGLSREEREHVEELARMAVEAWIDAKRWDGTLEPATALQRALAEYHDALMQV